MNPGSLQSIAIQGNAPGDVEIFGNGFNQSIELLPCERWCVEVPQSKYVDEATQSELQEGLFFCLWGPTCKGTSKTPQPTPTVQEWWMGFIYGRQMTSKPDIKF